MWTERMLSAPANGVKGGEWFSLMDKVFAPGTLALAWAKVRASKGAAGVDGQSVERFAAKADLHLSELPTALREGRCLPQPVKRVDIPKGDGKTSPLGIPTVKLARSRTFVDLDKLIRRRLHALLRRQEKRPAIGRGFDDRRRWPHAYFAKAGVFALHAAWQTARRSR